jgi:hypothetical protein
VEEREKIKWDIRRYVNGDESAIIGLYCNVMGRHMDQDASDEDHWKWEFDGEPWRPKDIVLAWNGDVLAAHYGLIRRRFAVSGQLTVGSLSLDTVTHPDYRGQSLFPTLARQIYGDLAQDSVCLTYGFPNKNSIRGFLRLGWTEVFPIPLRVYPLRLGKLVKLKWQIPDWTRRTLDLFSYDPFRPLGRLQLGGLEIQIMDRMEFGPEFDRLWEKSRSLFKIAAVRDSEFLRWRFQKRPGSAYSIMTCHIRGELVGYVIWRLRDFMGLRVAYIMDMLVEPTHLSALFFLLKRLTTCCARNNFDAISMVVPSHHPYSFWAACAGFLPVPRRFFPQEIYFGAYPHSDDLKALITDPKSWYISWADGDSL